MKLSENDIKEINEKLSSHFDEDNSQGIFFEPMGISSSDKGKLVVYMSWISGGETGNSYHSESYGRPVWDEGRPSFIALDYILDKLLPTITDNQRKEIDYLIIENDFDGESDYYFNYYRYSVEYIILDELLKLLQSFK